MQRRTRFDRRPPWFPSTPGIAAMALVGLFMVASAGAQTTYYAQGQAHKLNASQTEVHVQLEPGADADAVTAALAAAGHGALEAVTGVTDPAGIYRVSVDGLASTVRAGIEDLPGIAAARPAYFFPGADRPMFLTDRIIVRFREDVEGAVHLMAAAHGLEIVKHLDWLGEVYVMRLKDESGTDAAEVAAQVQAEDASVYAHPDAMGRLQTHAVTINDPFFAPQWHLENAGGDGGLIDADVDAPDAWEITQGEGVVVAILDDAVEVGHEDLVDNYTGIGFDPFSGGNDPSPVFPGEWHGTSVTGLICAAGNEIGVRGVAPEANFIGVSLLRFATDTNIAESFRFAKESGADVINNSWGTIPGFPVSDVEVDAIRDAAISGRGGRGILVLFSSGNSGLIINAAGGEPNIPEVMAIGASLRNDTLSCYSNFGLRQSVVAPGGGVTFLSDCFKADMVTTDVTGDDGYNSAGIPAFFGAPFPILPADPDELANKNYTNSFNGTSAASPVASGVAALTLSVNPNLRRTQLRNIIEHTADKPATFRAEFDPVTGHNIRFGHGRVNALQAVKAAQQGTLWPSPVDTIDAFVANDRVDLVWNNPRDDVQVSVLAVRSDTPITWAPDDLETYTVGDEVAPGVIVVQDAPFNTLSETGLAIEGFVEYALFVRNAQDRYSWGRRKAVSVTPAPGAVDEIRVTAQADRTVGEAPLAVQFAGGADADITPAEFRWDMDDAASTTLFGRSVRHTFTQPGVYQVRLNVTDNQQRTGEAVLIITVNPSNQLPTARIQASPTSGFAPITVSFTAGGNDPDGNIIRFVWDFGDSSTDEGPFVSHAYTVPGVYTATLTVLDNDGGSSQATVNIIVNGPGFTADPSVSGATDSSTTRLLPGLCGAFGVEALAAMFGFAALTYLHRRRD